MFDDYRGSIPLHTLLKMLDYGKCTVNVKGGSCFFGATTIYITANGPPRDVYRNAKHENIAQLERRITEIREFPGMCTEDRSGVILLLTPVMPNQRGTRRSAGLRPDPLGRSAFGLPRWRGFLGASRHRWIQLCVS